SFHRVLAIMRVLYFVLCILMVIVPSAQVCQDDPGWGNRCKLGRKHCHSPVGTEKVKAIKKHCAKTCGFC
ncbi:hypothetical protein V3C99_016528, partial [Haemonchus contortus]